MIQIFPHIEYTDTSPYSSGTLIPQRILWHGVHTCVETVCSATQQAVIATLPVGHGQLNKYQVNTSTGEIFCRDEVRQWFGKPLLHSLQHPAQDDIPLEVEQFRKVNKIVILNCIDNLYGHALLKLFNSERHLNEQNEIGLVVLIQDNLRWLVPDGVAEIWTAILPLRKAKQYYPSLNSKIHTECSRFSEIYVSQGFSHPQIQNISLFTHVAKHDVMSEKYRITFIWRDDRPWSNSAIGAALLKTFRLNAVVLALQNKKIVSLFTKIRKQLPGVVFTVSGAGTFSTFPGWIDDRRTDNFSPTIERSLCTVYSESRVVIGIHGSNMLLPSAHAGMTVDLMPKERWGNFAQDIVFQESDPRIGSFRYRFFPISTSVNVLAHLITTQVKEFEYYKKQMLH